MRLHSCIIQNVLSEIAINNFLRSITLYYLKVISWALLIHFTIQSIFYALSLPFHPRFPRVSSSLISLVSSSFLLLTVCFRSISQLFFHLTLFCFCLLYTSPRLLSCPDQGILWLIQSLCHTGLACCSCSDWFSSPLP